MNGVRVRREGWEGQCDACLHWWPLTNEFWYPIQGLRNCRACLNERKRAYLGVRRANPEVRAYEREGFRLYRQANHQYVLQRRREWWAKNRERECAKRRAWYATHKQHERRRAQKRDYMRRHREQLRAEIREGVAA